jgi:ABC-2 type transport system ATP-binding protein
MIIEVEKLVKDFKTDFWKKKKRALNGVSFSVEEGCIYGFLGPNGAGKTTTLKVLMGLIFPTSGSSKIFGRDTKEVSFKKDVGFLPENPYFYDYLKAKEFLKFYGELFGLTSRQIKERSNRLLEEVGLADEKDTQLRKFSKGMLQRIGLAQALINDPKLLILDEPMTGLDPIGRKQIRDLILRTRDQGKTVFFSSHILSDVEMICDQVSIIVAGQIVDSGYIKDLLNPKILFYELEFNQSQKQRLSGIIDKSLEITQRGKSIYIKAKDEIDLGKLNTRLIEKGVSITSVTPVKETLEDLFVKKVENKS